jgi:MFS family permease
MGATVTIALLAVSGLVVVSELYLPLPLIDAVAQSYGVSTAAAGLVSSAFGYAYAAGFLIFGPLSDRFGRKPVMVGGLAALAAATALTAMTQTFEQLIAARALQGFAASAFPPVALAYLSDRLPQQQRLWGVAWMSTAFLTAGLVGQIYGGAFAEAGLLAALWPAAVVYALAALALMRLPEGQPGQAGVQLPRIFVALPRLLTNPDLVRAYAAAFVLLLTFVAFYVALGQSRGEALAALGLDPLEVRVVALPGMLTALLAPKLMPRLGPVRVLVGGLTTAALALLATALVPGAPAAQGLAPLLLSVPFVAGISVCVPALIARISAVASDETRGAAVSFYTFILFVGASTGPFVPLWIGHGLTGDLLTAVCLVLALVLVAAAVANAARSGLTQTA